MDSLKFWAVADGGKVAIHASNLKGLHFTAPLDRAQAEYFAQRLLEAIEALPRLATESDLGLAA